MARLKWGSIRLPGAGAFRLSQFLPATLLLAALVIPGSAADLSAQVLRGSLLDDRTDQPVEGATVWLLNEDDIRLDRVTTDAEGRFLFRLELGVFLLHAERIGFQPTTSSPFAVEALDTTDVEFRISDQALTLAPISVSVGGPSAPEIFEARMATEEGVFFSPQMVDSLRPSTHIGEIFKHADGARVRWRWGITDDLQTGPIPSLETYRGYGCIHYIVDRTVVPKPMFGSSPWGVAPLSRVTPEELMAVELYRSWSEVPEDFRSALRIRNGQEAAALVDINRKVCGVAVIWTRSGWSG